MCVCVNVYHSILSCILGVCTFPPAGFNLPLNYLVEHLCSSCSGLFLPEVELAEAAVAE